MEDTEDLNDIRSNINNSITKTQTETLQTKEQQSRKP